MQDGIVVSFNRPGRNATGVSLFTDVLSAKRLELVRELIPNAAVIALLVDPNSRESVIESSEVQEAAHAIGQQIIVSKAGGEPDLVPVALLIAGSPFFTRRRDQLVGRDQLVALGAEQAHQGRKRGLGNEIDGRFQKIQITILTPKARRTFIGSCPFHLDPEGPNWADRLWQAMVGTNLSSGVQRIAQGLPAACADLFGLPPPSGFAALHDRHRG
jgi:ABC transporter substrate binding protein